eukprot:SAG11_NODE_806_length_7093_cov_1.965379_4_plen_57_part_00
MEEDTQHDLVGCKGEAHHVVADYSMDSVGTRYREVPLIWSVVGLEHIILLIKVIAR